MKKAFSGIPKTGPLLLTAYLNYAMLCIDIKIFMAKGFWLVTTTVTNPAFQEYVEGFSTWIKSVGGSVFAKDLKSETMEGKGGHLAVIIEFPSKEAALEAYKRDDYQELSKLRWANSMETNITIMDGSITH